MIRPNYIPPSILVEGLFCKRRLWLKANNVEMFDETMALAFAPGLKNHMQKNEFDDSDWMYEARLPSGTRIDAWIPGERLGIEFKSGRPHTSHLYQVWAMRQELEQLGVKGAELQLWYTTAYENEAARLAEYYALDHGYLDTGVYAICTDHDDPDFLVKMERSAAILTGELEAESLPPCKEPDSPVCQSCSYFMWCYAGVQIPEPIKESEKP